MSDVVIKAERVGKKFRLRHESHAPYTALRDVMARAAAAPWRWAGSRLRGDRAKPKSAAEDFWALRDVTFEIRRGDAVGIIGRNGAGKSTLLKILSRITEPTTGRVRIRGRVASLLEVGTGFHPELSGRENIFLNGAILGMSRAEIRRNFDEIVAFAEVERFLDTPVKHYSSGMYVRLAFAVAAHLEPEILVIDEVLAVGDAAFQKKCLGKMSEIATHGRTVLFVSHNMEAVLRLCRSAVLLKNGSVAMIGEPSPVVADYLRDGCGAAGMRRWEDTGTAPGNDVARLLEVRLHDERGVSATAFEVRQKIGISMTYEVLRDDIPLVDDFNVFNDHGLYLFATHNVTDPHYNRPRKRGRYTSTAWIPAHLLPDGLFFISAAMLTLAPFQIHFHEEQVVAFHVTDPMDGDSARGILHGEFPGAVRPLLQWEVREAE